MRLFHKKWLVCFNFLILNRESQISGGNYYYRATTRLVLIKTISKCWLPGNEVFCRSIMTLIIMPSIQKVFCGILPVTCTLVPPCASMSG